VGHNDIHNLHKIYQACNEFSDLCGLQFSFQEDSGHLETGIAISEYGETIKPTKLNFGGMGVWKIFVPDILDYHNKIIIEYEETPGEPRPGAKLARKGHDPDGQDKRTKNRDLYYDIGKFHLLKIFDYEFNDWTLWKIKLFRFLADCYEKIKELVL